MNSAVLIIKPDGTATGLYTEIIPLNEIGPLEITRATSIEFNNQDQLWQVKESNGAVIFQNRSRVICLAWEHQHFNH